MIIIRQMNDTEFDKIIDIDRSETVEAVYVVEQGRLIRKELSMNIPPWNQAGTGSSEADAFGPWRRWAEGDGVLLGAFNGDRLVGISIFRPDLMPGMGWLALLHISRDYRGQGIGRKLCCQIFERARQAGCTSIYVSSIETCRTVDFYRSLGFVVTDEPHPDLFELEPDDIHMIRQIHTDK